MYVSEPSFCQTLIRETQRDVSVQYRGGKKGFISSFCVKKKKSLVLIATLHFVKQ